MTTAAALLATLAFFTAVDTPVMPAAPEYRVGPGDVIEVEVIGNADLSRTPIVQTDGAVALPLLGEVPVAGMTVAEIKAHLTELLEKDYLVNPQVDVRVKDYQSQMVTVTGEVTSPGRRALRGGRMRVIDVLVEAGGLTPHASGEVVVSRSEGTFQDGSRTMRLQLGAPVLNAEQEQGLQVELRAGDIVTARPRYYVTVEGEVVRPGRYVLDNSLTVSGAISSAGGLTRFGSQRVKVRRIHGDTGRVEILEVDLKAVRKGKISDPQLQANDTISVTRRLL